MKRKEQLAEITDESTFSSQLSKKILELIVHIPASSMQKSNSPRAAAQSIINHSAKKAASYAGALALVPGPFGWFTIIPEIVKVCRIQSQMVSDIAAIYGKHDSLNTEQMMFCLFRHTAAQAVNALITRVGQRIVFRRASLRLLQTVAKKVGYRITQRVIGKSVSRWLPFIGAAGVSAYAYIDTRSIGLNAIELFEQDFEVESEQEEQRYDEPKRAVTRRPKVIYEVVESEVIKNDDHFRESNNSSTFLIISGIALGASIFSGLLSAIPCLLYDLQFPNTTNNYSRMVVQILIILFSMWCGGFAGLLLSFAATKDNNMRKNSSN